MTAGIILILGGAYILLMSALHFTNIFKLSRSLILASLCGSTAKGMFIMGLGFLLMGLAMHFEIGSLTLLLACFGIIVVGNYFEVKAYTKKRRAKKARNNEQLQS